MSLAIDLIKQDEGFRSLPYHDTEGHLTIGYGTLLPLDKREGELLLRKRLGDMTDELRILLPVFDTENHVRQAVAQSLIYNLGFSRLKSFKKMLAAWNRRDYSTAADELKDSKWFRQVKTRGPRLVDMLRSGETDAAPNPL